MRAIYFTIFILLIAPFPIDYLTHRKLFYPIGKSTQNSKRNLYVMLV